MFQVVCFLALASAQDVFLASSASAARRLEGAADGSASGGTAILDCKSCIGRCKQSRGVKCKKTCVKLSCVWQKDAQAEVCESCIKGCRLKPGKNKCRKTCVNEKLCVWQADIVPSTTPTTTKEAAVAGETAAYYVDGVECRDDEYNEGYACAEQVADHFMLCDFYLNALYNIDSTKKLYHVCKKSCNQCDQPWANIGRTACKDTVGIRCADITSAMGTRMCSLSISAIGQDSWPGYSGDTSKRIDQVCKRSCDECACFDADTIRCADITRYCNSEATVADVPEDFTQGYSGDTSKYIDQVCKRSCEQCTPGPPGP